MNLEKVAQKDVFLSIAEAMVVQNETPIEKIGIENLKRFVLFSFEFGKELIDFTKPRSERKAITFEALDLIPFISDITQLPKTFEYILAEVRDLDSQEITDIANFISIKVPNINRISLEQQRRLIQNIITVAFAIYQLSIDINAITQK